MRYETPEHIIITIIQSAISGDAVYWIVSPYTHKYEKGRKFLRFFILLEFVHRLFRTFCYYRVSKVIWTTEYLLYYILMLAVFMVFLSENLAKHLVNIFAAAFLFDLFGTVSMIGMLFIQEGGSLEKALAIMDFSNRKALVIFVIACILGAYFIRMLMEAMGRSTSKWVNAVKIILAVTGVYSRSKAEYSIVFFGVPVFIGILLLNTYYQSCSYKRARTDYEELEKQGKSYDDKTEELYVIEQETLKYLDEGCRTGDPEYKQEIIEHFETALQRRENI